MISGRRPRWVHPPLEPGWIDRPHERVSIGDLPLESGETILDCEVSYVIHGTADAARDNVVLGLTAIGSTHHRLDDLIGPGRPLDPDRYCTIVVDAIGNGLSTSPSNSQKQPDLAFPRFSLRDMVESQRRLLDVMVAISLSGASSEGSGCLRIAFTSTPTHCRVACIRYINARPESDVGQWTPSRSARADCMAEDPLPSLASKGDQSQDGENGAFSVGRNNDHRVRWMAGMEERIWARY